MMFLSPVVALYLYKSAIRPCMKYCYQVWAGAPSCNLALLDKLQKWICRTVGPSLATSLETLAHCQMYPAELFSIDVTLVDVHLNWLYWAHFLFLEEGLLVILIDSKIFLLPFLDVTRTSMSTDFFLTQLDSLPIECFPLTYNLWYLSLKLTDTY